MLPGANPIVDTYSRLAGEYDDDLNEHSCWGRATKKALASIVLKDSYQLVVDVGCGTGRALSYLAPASKPWTRFVGIDPAPNMRARATARVQALPNVEIRDGSFEQLPLESQSVDYLLSTFAFHWTTDLNAAVKEMARVLRPDGEMDLFFTGRHNGREFIQKTTPIFLRYMGPVLLVNSARLRKQLTREAALQLFAQSFTEPQLRVEESNLTYYDSLQGHWGWWVRVEGHFVQIPAEKKQACYAEVKEALASLRETEGIPYTIHQLHVKLCRR